MTDTRKNIKAAASVKSELEAIQTELKTTASQMKTESMVIAYLAAMYRDQKKKISLADHQKYLKEAEETNHQASL